jgi:hypothetical protein
MLDFCFIRDEQPMHAGGLTQAGSIEWEEFDGAQELEIIERHLDYYGKLRWNSEQVKQKRSLLTPAVAAVIPNLASIVKRAFAAECGLVAFGD